MTMLNRVLELQENDVALKYAEHPEELRKLLNEISIETKLIGVDFFFDGDKETRMILRIIIKRGNNRINFRFGMSILDTERLLSGEAIKIREVLNGLLCDVLGCVRNEFYCPPTFDDFCGESGYDTDSRKALSSFKALQKQSKKLQLIFTDEEIEYLPQ